LGTTPYDAGGCRLCDAHNQLAGGGRRHSLVFGKVVVKVDLVCADDLKLFIDDGGSEVVDCELDA
jgi:hypothetical protein